MFCVEFSHLYSVFVEQSVANAPQCFLVGFLSASQPQVPAVLDGSSDELCCIFRSVEGLMTLCSVVTMDFQSVRKDASVIGGRRYCSS